MRTAVVAEDLEVGGGPPWRHLGQTLKSWLSVTALTAGGVPAGTLSCSLPTRNE